MWCCYNNLILGLLAILLGFFGNNFLLVGKAAYAATTASASYSTTLVLQHDLNVKLEFNKGQISITDIITLPASTEEKRFEFTLGKAFTISNHPKDLHTVQTSAQTILYQMPVIAQQTQIVLHYSAKIDSTPHCQWLTETCRMFNETGLYLDQGSYWYPETISGLHRFSLKVELPEGWSSISQGVYHHDHWEEKQAQQNIYLIAAPFKHYHKNYNGIEISVYLRQDDAVLAERYLQATEHYLALFSKQLGAYPYQKFATVESFWETGWGMPSFTLLGSRVMRLPFIIDSAFAHEIMHNWWGNGVYVDTRMGNWSEGLTAYLADHAIKAQQNEDAAYRRDQLQKFAHFVTQQQDAALKDFTSRHDQTTQAIGYGKSLMLFHMLRQHIGDALFYQALQDFFKDYQFRAASFSELEQTFTKVSHQDMSKFFTQWRDQSGIPELRLLAVESISNTPMPRLKITLKQLQTPLFKLAIPIIIHTQADKAERHIVQMTEYEQSFELSSQTTPISIAVDPDFEVFRRPQTGELPAALDQLYTQTPKTVVLARQTDKMMQPAWEALAKQWAAINPGITIQYDDEPLPNSGMLILLGGDNAALTHFLEQTGQSSNLTELSTILSQEGYLCGIHTLAVTFSAGEQNVLLLAADNPDGLDKLIAKLPHYGKYSYVIFHSISGDNIAKGQWVVTDSPMNMMIKMPPPLLRDKQTQHFYGDLTHTYALFSNPHRPYFELHRLNPPLA